jgi:hypothetical protein
MDQRRAGPRVREVRTSMTRKAGGTVPPGARPAPPEGRTSGAPDAQRAAAYWRAATQRCWACNAPDAEPVRLPRWTGKGWKTDATVQRCTACLSALRIPRLVRQLGLKRPTAAPPAAPAPVEGAPVEGAGPGAGAPAELLLALLRGA